MSDCTITINGHRKETVALGRPLLFSLMSKKIFLPSACGGHGQCGCCKVRVTRGGGPRLPAEERLLTPAQKAQGMRLACQLTVNEDLEIVLPDELLRPASQRPEA